MSPAQVCRSSSSTTKTSCATGGSCNGHPRARRPWPCGGCHRSSEKIGRINPIRLVFPQSAHSAVLSWPFARQKATRMPGSNFGAARNIPTAKARSLSKPTQLSRSGGQLQKIWRSPWTLSMRATLGQNLCWRSHGAGQAAWERG